jgi:hypothetical protein
MLSNGKMSVSVVKSATVVVTENPERAGADFDNYSPKTFIDAAVRADNDRDFARNPTVILQWYQRLPEAPRPMIFHLSKAFSAATHAASSLSRQAHLGSVLLAL